MQRRVVEGYRLSPQQKRLWSLQHDSSTYRAQCMVEIDGPLNKVTLLECLQYLVGRHDVLRTVFHRLAGMKTPVQVVKNGTDIDWQEHDLTGAEDQNARVDELYERHARSEFNLEQGPALQASLIAISEPKHVLILSLPGLCSDSQSITNLVKKVARAYAQRTAAQTGPKDEVQYAQYSEWQNSLAADASQKPTSLQSLTAPASFKLPLEIKANDPAPFKPASVEIVFDPGAAGSLAEAAQRNNASVEEFLFACWVALIRWLSSEQEIVIGRLWNGRGHERLQDALGLFAKWLPVGGRPKKDHEPGAVIDQIKKSWQETFDFRERFIWGDNDQPGEPASFPSIGFECESQAEIVDAGEVTMRVARQRVFTDRFKVKLVCRLGEPVRAELHFDEATITRVEAQLIASRFSEVVRKAAGASRFTIGDLNVLGGEERRQVLNEWNDTRREYPTDKGVVSLFEEQAKLHAREIAVEYEGQWITYEELNKRANQLARHLRAKGVRAESAVAIILERSIDLVIALLAVMKSGGAYVPLDPHLPKKRIALMLEDCGSPLIITDRGSHATSEGAGSEVIYIDSEMIARESVDNLERTHSPENLAYILFTSGSTGKPKGVAVEHRQLLNYINAVSERLDLPSAASYATVSTFSADLGNTVIFPSLCMGGRLHVISQERASDPLALANYFASHTIDCLKIVPSHLMALLASSTSESPIPRQRLILGGEASHWSLIDKIKSLKHDCLIFNHYGPTETTVGVATYDVSRAERPASAATVPIGKPIFNIAAYILDSDLMPVPIGVAGELYFGGEGVTRGYFNHPELTADRFLPDPITARDGARMYRTGDLGRYLPDGNIEFLGRADHQIKYHGFRVELAEIVAALNRHPKIRNSVVRIIRDKNGEDTLVAYYVSRKEIEMGELRVFLSDTIIEETLPNVFVHLRKLPLTINGKINYDLLPTLEEARQRTGKEFLAPRNQTEETLAQICADVLGLESVNLNDNFFELGGHSLLATRVISRINETWKLEIPVRRLFESRSIAALAEMIADEMGQQERDPEPPIAAIHRRTRSIDEQLAELNQISEDEARAMLDV